jgi:Mg/Co/Ni transporter MgtE
MNKKEKKNLQKNILIAVFTGAILAIIAGNIQFYLGSDYITPILHIHVLTFSMIFGATIAAIIIFLMYKLLKK